MRSLVLLFLIGFTAFGQEVTPFSGRLIYSIQACDTALQKTIPTSYMVIYTNDTLLRIENMTEHLGKQILIKHFIANKSYLLVNTPSGKYAIQTDYSLQKKDSLPYTFKTKWGHKTWNGMKVKRAIVRSKKFNTKLEFLYLPSMSSKYLNNFENAPGLPIHYYISSVEGWFEYTLVLIEKQAVEKSFFGIPSDYKKVSFDQFMDELQQAKGLQEKDKN
jgi:hypothetical protein